MIARPVPSGAVLGSRGVLGLVTATIALANFSDLLHSLTDVQGTRVFMIDHNMAVIAAADTPEHDLIEIVAPEDIASVNASGGRFCVSSAGGGTGNQTVTYGCHWLFTHYPSYAPLRAFTVLQSLAAILEGNFTQVIPHGSSLANVAGFAEAIRNAVVRRIEVGGEDTYACAVGVPLRYAAPNGAALAFTLASFIPASAVDGGVSRARNLAIGITSGILILAIILSTIFIRQVLAPLERVVRSMASVVVDIGVDDLRAGAADRRKRRHRRLAAAKDDGCVKGSTDETLASTPTPQLIGSVDPLQNALPETTQADRYAPRSSGPEGSSEATGTLVNVPIAVDHEATRAFPMMPPGELLLLTATDGTGTTAAGPCGAQSAAVPKAATCTHRSDVSLASTEIPGAVMDDKVDNLAAAFDTAPAFDHSGYKYPHTDMDFSPPVLSDDALFPDSPLTATFDGPEGTHARDDNTDTRSTSSTASNGADESQSHLSEITSLLKAYADLRSTMASVSRYVPRDVVQELHATRELGQVAVRPARCSILFADIAGFTKLCDAVPPGALSGAVRVYFDRMSRLVHLYGGIVDKFIGDCVMAVWGAPQRAHHIELRAALCAQAIVPAAFAEPLLSAFRAVQHTLSIRVGAASGEVLAGNMGSPDRMSYTVIGDAVNLAARLESFNKQWGTNVMISEEIAREVAPVIVTRLVMHARIADRADPVGVYDIAGLYPDAVARLSRIQRGLPPAEDLHHATKGVPAAAAPVSFLAVGDGAAGPPSASAAATATETAAGSPLASSSEDSVAGGRARPTATDAADYLRAAAPPPIARVPVAALVELTARRYPAPPSVVDFCARYSAAAFLVHRRQFAAAAAQLRTLVPTTPVGRLFDGRQSVSRLLAVAEREQHSESSSRGRSVGSPGKPPRPKRH
jgi:class 3 adenylate cyclase